ncbi:MAG: GNAT family N-acetyltransferase [Chlamydiia bacterium]|nr:GNAT family N-acetyltransferase [Chlamydiia bacterium]
MNLSVDEELTLALLRLNDSAKLFQLVDHNRLHLRRFLNWVDGTQTESDSKIFIEQSLIDKHTLTLGIWNQQQLVGLIDYHAIDNINHAASIGYWIDQAHQGKGVMTRSVKALIGYGFSALQLHRIEIRCAVDNLKSARIPQALGFQEEGILRDAEYVNGRYHDVKVYSLLS